MNHIFEEIAAERKRQNEKWGEQNHPMHFDDLVYAGCRKKLDDLRHMNDWREKENTLSWFDILEEEVYEAFAETDPVRQKAEMVQVAAVAVQIIEYLDRRISKEDVRCSNI